MLFRKKAANKTYDPEVEKPVLRCSICTGEQVAGFRNLQTGAFREEACIKTEKDLETFLKCYGLTGIEKEY